MINSSANIRGELKIWSWYFLTLLLANFFHETGHCIPAWINGYAAIPTLAKEYPLTTIPPEIIKYVSLGGITISILFPLSLMIYFLRSSFSYKATILAGSLAMPAIYTLRFILSGRGHDETEFQEAQSALGLSYSGHFLDWLFLSISIAGMAIWIIESKPKLKITGRLLIGGAVSILFIILLQKINNLIFDPFFS